MAEPMRSPLRSPFPTSPATDRAPPPAPHNTPEKSDLPPPPPHPLPPPAAIAAHASRREPSRPIEGATSGWYSWTGEDNVNDRSVREVSGTRRVAGSVERGDLTSDDQSSVVSDITSRARRAAAVRRAAVMARVLAAALCLVAFSILAADRNRGWALDSYNRYSEFRYCEAVNVIGFVYSGFQLYAMLHYKKNEKHIIHRPAGNYFDFVMDQILAYLLISSASSAIARIGDWVVNWGTDPFPNMANGSVAVSFLAFLTFAVSSLLSAYTLFCKTI